MFKLGIAFLFSEFFVQGLCSKLSNPNASLYPNKKKGPAAYTTGPSDMELAQAIAWRQQATPGARSIRCSDIRSPPLVGRE